MGEQPDEEGSDSLPGDGEDPESGEAGESDTPSDPADDDEVVASDETDEDVDSSGEDSQGTNDGPGDGQREGDAGDQDSDGSDTGGEAPDSGEDDATADQAEDVDDHDDEAADDHADGRVDEDEDGHADEDGADGDSWEDLEADAPDEVHPVEPAEDSDRSAEEDGTESDEEGPTVESLTQHPQDLETDDPRREGVGWSGDGPESDEEMPLADHIEEMMRRLGIVFLIGGTVTLLVFGLGRAFEPIPSAVEIIDLLWNHNIPGAPENPARRPRVYGPLELLITKLKVAGLAGLVASLPVFVYQTYRFMRPGLYPNERRYYLAAVPTSLVLGIVGVAFAHFLVLPAIFSYFTAYTEGTAVIAFGLKETFRLILLLMGYMAIVFQIPLFIQLAIMMDLVSRRWLEDKRLIFWGAFLGLAFIVSPDPTGMAPIIVATTMVALYESTLALLRWTGH